MYTSSALSMTVKPGFLKAKTWLLLPHSFLPVVPTLSDQTEGVGCFQIVSNSNITIFLRECWYKICYELTLWCYVYSGIYLFYAPVKKKKKRNTMITALMIQVYY